MKLHSVKYLSKLLAAAGIITICLIQFACSDDGDAVTTDTTSNQGGGTSIPTDAKAGPVYYLDEAFQSTVTTTGTNGLSYPSGWDVDARGGELVALTSTEFSLWDKSGEFPVVLNREINNIEHGVVTFDTAFIVKNYATDFYYELKNADSKTVLKLMTQNDEFGYSDADGKFQRLSRCDVMVEYGLSVDLDFDNGTADIRVNGKLLSSVGLLSDDPGLKYITIGTTDSGKTYVTLKFVKVYQNYLVNDSFISAANNISDKWELKATNKSFCEVTFKTGTGYPDQNSLSTFSGGSGESLSLSRRFDAANGKFVFQASFMLSKAMDGVSFKLNNGDTPVVAVGINGENLVCGSKEIYKYQLNMWYILRIEADTKTGKARIKLNGKDIGTADFTAASIDGIAIENNASERGTLMIDDITAYLQLPEPADYVAKPVAAESDGYYIGMQSCSLWRNGYHVGWDCVTPFDEITPYLGYYDEGSPEVSDWEIKWMVEHGVDYNLFCWFLPLDWNKNDPIKTPYSSAALHDGFFNAKYSDMMKYAIMWENYSAVVSSQVFREKIIPYWVEYYLKDPRYMTVDNKAVITIYKWDTLIKSFGDAAGVRAELDYLRNVCKGLGYDGAIILIQSSDLDAPNLTKVSELGFDAMYRYSWGGPSYDIQTQKTKTETQKKLATIDVVPNVSMGYNNVAWNGLRNPFVSMADYKALLSWMKDTYMPSYSSASLASKMLFLDNWNEYGEGHYMMPSSLAGFGYLDAVRSVFTKAAAEHDDVIPTEAQKSRINYLFPQNRVVLRQLFTNTVTSTGYIFKIDGKAQTLDEIPVYENNVLLIPVNPVSQIIEKLNAVYKYDAATKEFRIWRNDVNIVFTIGSDTARVNRKDTSIGCKVYLSDGLPMLPIKLICDTFGYTLQAESSFILITTDRYDKIKTATDIANARVSGEWEFALDDDYESFTQSKSIYGFIVKDSLLSGSVKGDYGTLTSGTTSVNAASKRYMHLRIKCTGTSNSKFDVYFTTNTDKVWTADKMVSINLEKSDEFKEYIIDMGTSANWSGVVNKLMLNLCKGGGSFEIDYIRLSTKAVS